MTDGHLDAIERSVRAEGAVAIASAFDRSVKPAARKAAIASLVGRGLEATSKHLRVALLSQLSAIVEARGAVLVRSLPALLRGAPKASELKATIAKATSAGRAARVQLAEGEALARPGTPTVSARDLAALREAVAALAAVTGGKKAAPPPTLEFVAGLAASLVAAVDEARARSRRTLALSLLRKLEEAPGALVATAALVRSARALDGGFDGGHLLTLAREGVIELRPDSALSLLSEEDRALCPADVAGTALSYARRREPSDPGGAR